MPSPTRGSHDDARRNAASRGRTEALRSRADASRAGPDASRRYHDRVARRYDAIYHDAYWRFHDELTWRRIKPHLPRDLAVECLDLGCGTGKWGLRLLKSGFATTFVDHSAAMIEQVRVKLDAMGPRQRKAHPLVADIVDLSALGDGRFGLALALGDPLSICADAEAAVREIRRVLAAGGLVIATADNRAAALEHYLQKGDVDGLERLVETGRTHWLTDDPAERFDLTTFTPCQFRRLFERAGFEVLELRGKTILPLRGSALLDDHSAVPRLMRIEERLAEDESTAARAGHLQIVARKPSA